MCRLIGFGMFEKYSRPQIEIVKMDHYFNVYQNRIMCTCLKIFFQPNEITPFGGLNLFS
jgi:hypothetical protein